MTPAELRAIAAVMREMGVFRVTLDGVTVEMSAAALQMGMAEKLEASGAKPAVVPAQTEPAPRPDEEDDAMLYAATEGLPGDER